ncbi:MAG: lipopolysaccharide heptosyltransferase II [Gemmatimonadetes bacterium]|nr:lipopolysaccharide heptosyltransferase II [Gemmatimonadota bacterium]
MSSLVIQTSFLGDTVLSTPLIAALAAREPVDVVVTPLGASLLRDNPAVRALMVYDKRGRDAGIAGLRRLARELRGKYSAVYLAQGSLRSAVLARAARIPRRVGFDTSAGRALYTERIRYRRDAHHAERLWRLAAGDDAPSPPPEVIRPHLYPSAADRAAVDALLTELPAGGPLVGLAPGSIWGTKRWPHVAALTTLLDEVRFVVIGSGEDAALAETVAAAAPGRVLDATGRLTLLASAELIRRCAVLVANDSAPTHLASGVDTPTITLFGPTVPAFGFGPLAPRSEAIGVDGLECRPCHPHGPRECPLGHFACMQTLEPSRVAARVRNLLSHHPASQ